VKSAISMYASWTLGRNQHILRSSELSESAWHCSVEVDRPRQVREGVVDRGEPVWVMQSSSNVVKLCGRIGC